MSLEKLIESVPEAIKIEHKVKGGEPNIISHGFRIKFVPQLGIWQCGYSTYTSKAKEKEHQRYIGVGYSIIEAVDDFVSNKFKNCNKI